MGVRSVMFVQGNNALQMSSWGTENVALKNLAGVLGRSHRMRGKTFRKAFPLPGCGYPQDHEGRQVVSILFWETEEGYSHRNVSPHAMFWKSLTSKVPERGQHVGLFLPVELRGAARRTIHVCNKTRKRAKHKEGLGTIACSQPPLFYSTFS